MSTPTCVIALLRRQETCNEAGQQHRGGSVHEVVGHETVNLSSDQDWSEHLRTPLEEHSDRARVGDRKCGGTSTVLDPVCSRVASPR